MPMRFAHLNRTVLRRDRYYGEQPVLTYRSKFSVHTHIMLVFHLIAQSNQVFIGGDFYMLKYMHQTSHPCRSMLLRHKTGWGVHATFIMGEGGLCVPFHSH